MSCLLEVLRSGPLATVQDRGRLGLRSIGVSPSGAADRGALARANAIAGNGDEAAVIEVTLGGLRVRARGAVVVALSGAACAGVAMEQPLRLADGDELRLGTPASGLRTYVAVRGGVLVPAVLGSRSRDTLSGLGPAPLRAGHLLPVGDFDAGHLVPAGTLGASDGDDGSAPCAPTDNHDRAPSQAAMPGVIHLELIPGPRDDWLPAAGWTALHRATWTVSAESDRVAVRLQGPALPVAAGTLPPEPLVRGAMQVTPDGLPIIFGPDHPVTGGYPVVAVLTDAACDLLAQQRPGAHVRVSASGAAAPE